MTTFSVPPSLPTDSPQTPVRAPRSELELAAQQLAGIQRFNEARRLAEAAADAVAARFGRSIVGPASLLGRTDLRRTENHPHSTVVPLSDPPTPS